MAERKLPLVRRGLERVDLRHQRDIDVVPHP
jgi:hypothetical protein